MLHHACDCDVPSGLLLHEVLVLAFDQLRSGPYEHPATVRLAPLPGVFTKACFTYCLGSRMTTNCSNNYLEDNYPAHVAGVPVSF